MTVFDSQEGTSVAGHGAVLSGPEHKHSLALPKRSSIVIQESCGPQRTRASLSDRLDRKLVLEGELNEAAFVVCFPNGQPTPSPVSAPRTLDEPLDNALNGGCVLSVWDSDLADDWVDENYDHALLVLIRKKHMGGPIPSLLSVNVPALSIFGETSVSLMRIAEDLANFSGFPVIVRPLEEDPSRFRNYEHGSAGYTVADSVYEAGGNAAYGDTDRENGSAKNPSQDGSINNPANSPKRTGKRRERDRDSDDDERFRRTPGSPHSSLSPSIQGATSKEVAHRTDVTLTLSNTSDSEVGGYFVRVLTKVKFCPPNPKEKTNIQARNIFVSEPSIEGHIELQIKSGESVKIDNALGSLGFLAHVPNYLEDEELRSLGYSVPAHKIKYVASKERSETVGTAGVVRGNTGGATGRTTSSTIEVADDSDAVLDSEQWLVSLQRVQCNWDNNASGYRGLNVMIQPHYVPTSAHPVDVQAKYGMAVAVADHTYPEAKPQVSFIYRHQIHCWIKVKSKSRYRGLIVLAAHSIPDIRIEQCLQIQRCLTLALDLPSNKIGEVSEANSPGASSKADIGVQRTCGAEGTNNSPQGTSKAAMAPATQKMSWTKRLIQQLFKGTRKRKTTLSGSTLVSHDLRRRSVGWDHTNMEWYYPIWPELDCESGRSSDKSRTGWRLDWRDEDDHNSETLGTYD